MIKIYDLVIIGSGPAGLTAGIYAIRAKLDTLMIEKTGMSGGQIINTTEVDNYPGLPGVGGFELAMKMRSHYNEFGGHCISGEVTGIKDGPVKEIILSDGTSYMTRSIIIAGGAAYRKLGVPGEEKLTGSGVSYCATCDGAFFRSKTVAVVGGGDVALEDALFLSRICLKVFCIHRRDTFRGAPVMAERLLALNNVTALWNTVVESIEGDDCVERIRIKNVIDQTEESLDIDGIFVAVGMQPLSDIYKNLVACDDYGYIIADETCQTNVPGIFAAGDIRTKPLRQVIGAASDGANAVYSVQKYLNALE